MKKFFLISTLFGAMVLALSSCMDDKEPVYYVWNEPAITDSLNNVPVIKTAYGTYAAPTLPATMPRGTHLWVSFILDKGNQPNNGSLLTVSSLKHQKIGTSHVEIISGEMPGNEDEYTDSIMKIDLCNSYIGNVLYFGFSQEAPEGQQFEYRLICNIDSVSEKDNIPTLYIKSKRVGSRPAGSDKKTVVNYGFDMTPFIESYHLFEGDRPTTSSLITFKLKYKIGTFNGEDYYESYKKNPIHWRRTTYMEQEN